MFLVVMAHEEKRYFSYTINVFYYG